MLFIWIKLFKAVFVTIWNKFDLFVFVFDMNFRIWTQPCCQVIILTMQGQVAINPPFPYSISNGSTLDVPRYWLLLDNSGPQGWPLLKTIQTIQLGVWTWSLLVLAITDLGSWIITTFLANYPKKLMNIQWQGVTISQKKSDEPGTKSDSQSKDWPRLHPVDISMQNYLSFK